MQGETLKKVNLFSKILTNSRSIITTPHSLQRYSISSFSTRVL